VVIEVPGEAPLLLDLGTGLRSYGHELDQRLGVDAPLALSALLTHLHWDHVIGLPFFAPVQRPGNRLDVYGPSQEAGTLHEVIDRMVQPPFFPVHMGELRGDIVFHDVDEDDLAVGAAKVKIRRVPHLGITLGFRVEIEGRSVAYVSDHQAPPDRRSVAAGVLELCDGADLVIHDAQYTEEEFVQKGDWGHSTVEYAVHVACEAGARRLALFHHDPAHSDEDLDRIVEQACASPDAARLDAVVAAAEGLSIDLPRP
jgi:phosphoribosyl 1,2-cyclic phosphodiesterase